MFAATRVMAAGKAGLESLPYFVDELLAQGIPQLAPWGADHSNEPIATLNRVTQERRAGAWKRVYDIGNNLGASDLGTIMQPDMAAAQRLLRRVNPLAAATGLADSPAQLAAWCRGGIWQHCRDTYNLWERFKYDNGIARGHQLAVVIPYCPEGPTSGTVGMYLGAALRKFFADMGEEHELVVWGIELCPPLDTDDAGRMDALAVQNTFRGYVARDELLRGVPLSQDHDDGDSHLPFDINIVFDGGRTNAQAATSSRDDIWKALDRAAAQTTACLLNGATGGDVDESTNWLKQGKRWNAHLVHVVSELSYNSACRYLRYRVCFPWHRNPERWDNTNVSGRKEAVLRRIDDDIRPMLAHETDSYVKERIEHLVDKGERLRTMKKSLFNSRQKEITALLDEIIEDERAIYDRVREDNYSPDRIIPKTDPFCINIVLPERLRREAAEQWRDNDSPTPIGDVLGVNGALHVRDRIEDLFAEVLRRSDCKIDSSDSQAFFEEIIGISIEDRSRSVDNEEFRPALEFLLDFMDHKQQKLPGAFNTLTYDLSDKIRVPVSTGNERAGQPKALGWHPTKDADYDVPVEYSFMTLARCRPEDRFKDISTYDDLLDLYQQQTGSLSRWMEFARYYGVALPPELREEQPPYVAEEIPAGDVVPSDRRELERGTNGYGMEPSIVAEPPDAG